MSTKESVLETLEKNRGRFISGAELAKNCGVSRNAVWKSVTELRRNGYVIKSASNRGYMLEDGSDIVSRAGICMYLEQYAGTDPCMDERIHVYEELDSTNNEAKRSLIFTDRRMLHGTVIAAKRQSAGRGHGGGAFFSPEGGIYFSIILEPERLAGSQGPVAGTAAEAVIKVLEELFGVSVERKKDSSLYLGEEKVCGILTEGICDMETGVFSNYIVGIGIRAEKLCTLSGKQPQKNRIIAGIIKELVL